MENDTNSITDCGVKERGIALRVLYRLELLGLQLDHARLANPYRGITGDWWVQSNDQVEGPCPWRGVLKLLVAGRSPIFVLHESVAGENPAPWQELRYAPRWKNRGKAMLWSVGFWFILAFIGYAVLTGMMPFQLRSATGLLYWLAIAIGGAWQGYRRLKPKAAATETDAAPQPRMGKLAREVPQSLQASP